MWPSATSRAMIGIDPAALLSLLHPLALSMLGGGGGGARVLWRRADLPVPVA